MASAAVSTFSSYNNPPTLTKHCGVVYCCQSLENFSINCIKCSLEFNLLSCNLFIKHIKTCMVLEVADRKNQDLIDKVERDIQSTVACLDPLVPIDQEVIKKEEEECISTGVLDGKDQTSVDNTIWKPSITNMPLNEVTDLALNSAQITNSESDPLMYFEQEEEKTLQLIEDNSQEDQKSDEEAQKRLIGGIIDEYKKHPVLWDANLVKSASKATLSYHYQQIRTAISTKFKVNLTSLQLRRKIYCLRQSFKRACLRKEKLEQHFNEPNVPFEPVWFFSKISFIDETLEDVKVEEPNSDDGEEGDKTNNQQSTPHEKSERGIFRNTKILDKWRVTLALIDQYKRHRLLWDENAPYYSDKMVRKGALIKIARFINTRFRTEVTYTEVKDRIVKLRGAYRRAQRTKSNSKRLWYYDKFTFIDQKVKRIANDSQSNSTDLSNFKDASTDAIVKNEDQPVDSFSSESDASEGEDSFEDRNLKRRETLQSTQYIAMIELYQSSPNLWDTNHPLYTSNRERNNSFQKIVEILRKDHNCHLTVTQYRQKIRFLRCSYFRALRENTTAKSSKSKPWFYNRMKFLEPFAKNATKPETDIPVKLEVGEDIAFLTENRTLMLNFIEQYKSHGCLWDQKRKNRNDTQAKEKALDKLMNMFSRENAKITKDQLSSAIRLLHSAALTGRKRTSQTDDPKIWFCEHLQFLSSIPKEDNKFCSHCNQGFRSIAEYEKHKIEIAGDYPYKCVQCNIGFLSRSKFCYHKKTHREPFKCDQCDFTAIDERNFEVHMRRHNGIQLFQCKLCEKKFVTSTELNRHLRMHTGEKPFVCDICGKALPANSELNKHMKRHRNQRDHKCNVCGHAFYTPKCLKDHMVTHTNERRHVCETCGAAFKQRKTLLQHKALHMTEKKHACKICGKSFAQKAGVHSHMKTHGLAAKS